jgi:ubiquinone/menaquinone biosynthesis C-methylase UbiE
MDSENICANWSQWLKNTRFSHLSEEQKEQTLRWLLTIRDVILDTANIQAGEKIIDLGCGTGLLGFGAIEKFQDSVELIFSDKFQDCLTECETVLNGCSAAHKASFLLSDCTDIKLPDNSVDKALMRSVLVHILDKQKAINEIYRILKPGGVFTAFEPIIKSNTRYHQLVAPSVISDFEDFKRAEDEFMTDVNIPLTNFDQNTLADNLNAAGFSDATVDVNVTRSSYEVSAPTVEGWFSGVPSPGEPSVKERFLKYFDEPKVDNYIAEIKKALDGQTVTIITNTVFIKATK